MTSIKNKGKKITPPRPLKDKVKQDSHLNLVALIDEANNLASKANPDLSILLNQDMTRLDQALDQLKIGDYCPSLITRLYNITNDISVNSENLGRNLLVEITDSLCNMLEGRDAIENDKEREVLMAHVAAIRVILKQDETHPSTNEIAALLVASLRQAVLAL